MTAGDFRHALVTGGAGFIGSHLVRALLDRGMGVTVLDDLSTGTREAVDPRAAFVEGDIRSPDDVRRALRDADCVFHLAARVSVRASFESFYDDMETNILGTGNVMRCIDPSRIRHFVLASTMAVYADRAERSPVGEGHRLAPLSPYGVGKMTSEMIGAQVLGGLGVPFTALRYFNTYGVGQRFTPYVGVVTIFVTRLLRGEAPVIFGDGEQERDFVHVDDIVAGTVGALGGPPGTYNLGTGRGTTVRRVAELLVERIAPGLRPEHAPEQAGELRYSVADVAAAERAFGYRPSRALDREIDAVIAGIAERSGDGA